MSDRGVAAPDEKMRAWMQDVDDALHQLKARRLQGALEIESMNVADARLAASRSVPTKFVGSATWTQSVEYLGDPGPVVVGQSGDHALVTRDERGRIQQIVPQQMCWIISGPAAGLSVPTNTLTVVTAAGATQLSAPFALSKSYLGNGVFRAPIDGQYQLKLSGVWVGIADATLRQALQEVSTDGGATWGVQSTDYRVQAVTGENPYNLYTRDVQLAAGWMVRWSVRHRSAATPATYFNDQMSMTFLRGLI